VKQRFEDGLQEASHDVLRHPIPHDRDAEGTALLRAGAFGDVRSAQRPGAEPSGFHLAHQSAQIVLSVRLKHLDADLINSSGSSVPFDGFESLVHHQVGNATREGMCFDAHG
jgi:hypothetical protein